MKKTITLTVKATQIWDEETGKGHIHFRMQDCVGTIRDEQGNEIGSVSGCIGAGVELSDGKEMFGTYYIEPKDLWNAFCDAIGKTENKFG